MPHSLKSTNRAEIDIPEHHPSDRSPVKVRSAEVRLSEVYLDEVRLDEMCFVESRRGEVRPR
jgi:hypothetical protein